MTDTITFAEFKERVKAIVFPEGEAENLVATHDSYIVEALISLQTTIPCLRNYNVTFLDKADVREQCSANFAQIERGIVTRVYAFLPGSDCKRYYYEPRNIGFIENWMKSARCVTCSDSDTADISRSPSCNTQVDGDLACGEDYTNSDESDCGFKVSGRYFAVSSDNILAVAPRFPCGYKLAVHWTGIKRKYDDYDPIPDEGDLIAAVAKYVEGQRALRLDRDMALYERIMSQRGGDFSTIRADMIIRCKREMATPSSVEAIEGFNAVKPFIYNPLVNEKIVFAYIADWGRIGNDSKNVEQLVKSWDVDFIVTGGDNRYSTTYSALFATLPYYKTFVDRGLMFTAIGNHDTDDGDGIDEYYETFSYLPGNQRYYDFVRGNVHFFVTNTHSTGDAEPNGTGPGSIQAGWLEWAIKNSRSQFKIVIAQDPPFTSVNTGDYPGHSEVDLAYASWGADVLLSGDSHQYERLEGGTDGFPYIVAGTGGATLDGFNGTPLDTSLVRYNEQHGAIKGTVQNGSLKLEFFNVSGEVIDSITITK